MKLITNQMMIHDLLIREDLGEDLKETKDQLIHRMWREGQTKESEYTGPETFKDSKRPKPTGIFAKIY